MRDFPDADLGLMAAVTGYCRALHMADAAVLEDLCDARFLMHWVGADSQPRVIDKAAFVARVGKRTAFAGEPAYEILTVDVAGDEMAQVKLNVTVPPRIYTDQLGFFRVGGEWKLVTKLFRVASGPAMEG